MAGSDSAIPPMMLGPIMTAFGQMTEATKAQVAATLASAIITASGRPFSIQQALDIQRDIYNALHPNPNMGHYQEWAKTREAKLSKVYGPTSN